MCGDPGLGRVSEWCLSCKYKYHLLEHHRTPLKHHWHWPQKGLVTHYFKIKWTSWSFRECIPPSSPHLLAWLDHVFFITVTAEEDDLWCLVSELQPGVNGESEEIFYINDKLQEVRNEMNSLNKQGGRLVVVSWIYKEFFNLSVDCHVVTVGILNKCFRKSFVNWTFCSQTFLHPWLNSRKRMNQITNGTIRKCSWMNSHVSRFRGLQGVCRPKSE
jgi:hypothetical protein